MFTAPWIRSARFDLTFIMGPALFSVALVALLSVSGVKLEGVPPWSWLLLIVGVDVAHVYSTVFRTYLNRRTRETRTALLWGVPILCWCVGVLLYSLGAHVFWRVLAYLAVFHFIRQQYGFLRIYSRTEKRGNILDTALLVFSTVLPLLHWHVEGREYAWFIAGDFVSLPSIFPFRVLWFFYGALWLAYILKSFNQFNLPKTALLASTALSWILGIVVWKGDLAFTLTNVVAHGVPYMALVWHAEQKETRRSSGFIFAALGLLLLFAYLEEGLWDAWVWRERLELFPFFRDWPPVKDSAILSCLVPLLALPQAVHYVMDGFIWRTKDRPFVAR